MRSHAQELTFSDQLNKDVTVALCLLQLILDCFAELRIVWCSRKPDDQLPGFVLHRPVKFDERFRNYRSCPFIADLRSAIYQNRGFFRNHRAVSSVRLRPHDTFYGSSLIFQTKDSEAVALLGSAKLKVDDKPSDSRARATLLLT